MKKYFLVTFVALVCSSASASVYKMKCQSAESIPYTAQGVLDSDSRTFIFEDWNNVRTEKNVSTPSVILDERCGTITPFSENDLSFDITPGHVWGQDILQIPANSVKADAKSISAKVHTCWYDGDQNGSNDLLLSCTLELQR